MGVLGLGLKVGVGFTDGDFDGLVAEGKNFVVEVGFEFVLVEPFLPEMDPRVVEKEGGFVSAKTVESIGARDTCQPRDGEGMGRNHDLPKERQVFGASTGQASGALDVICAVLVDRSEEAFGLCRVVFAIASHDRKHFVSVIFGVEVDIFQAATDASIGGVADHGIAGGFEKIEGSIGRTVVVKEKIEVAFGGDRGEADLGVRAIVVKADRKERTAERV